MDNHHHHRRHHHHHDRNNNNVDTNATGGGGAATSARPRTVTTTTTGGSNIGSSSQNDIQCIMQCLRMCLAFVWTTQTFEGMSVEELQDVEVWCEGLAHIAKAAAKQQLSAVHGDEMPADIQRLCDPVLQFEWGSDEHKSLAQSAAQHVVAIVPFAHSSKVLKQRVRRIVGSQRFTAVAAHRGGGFKTLVQQCQAHMKRKGARLQAMYVARELEYQLGRYEAPVLRHEQFARLAPAAVAWSNTAAGPTREGQSVSAEDQATLTADRSTSGGVSHAAAVDDGWWLRQPVVAAAVPLFANTLPDGARDQPITGHEGPFIHLLRLLALAINTAFQSQVTERLAKAGIEVVGGEVFSRGIKGYDRMWNKLQSVNDHRFKEWPRPQFNLDVVRCLATFANEHDMRRGFGAVAQVFEGGAYVKFKNGMAASDAEASENYHLRLVLGVGLFVPAQRRTFGDLREDPNVQRVWSMYLAQQQRSPTVGRGMWKNHVHTALRWVRKELPATTSAGMLCEVQMLLREYRDARCSMHEMYKIARATQVAQLANDFRHHSVARQHRELFLEAGSSELMAACRDGAAGTLRRLLHERVSQSSPAGVGAGGDASRKLGRELGVCLAVAARYVRPHCVTIVLRCGALRLSQCWLDRALQGSCNVVSDRDGFALTAARTQIVAELLAAKALCNAARPDDGTTPLFSASQCGLVHVVKQLLSRKANCNLPRKNGQTPLHQASQLGHVDVVCALLGAKARCDRPETTRGGTAAAAGGHTEVLKTLLRAKADCNAVDFTGATPCYDAAERGAFGALAALVDAKADINRAETTGGFTPCHVAARDGFTDIVRQLVAARANVNAVTRSGVSTCAVAAQHARVEVLACLLDAKSDVDIVNGVGWSPLTCAAVCGHVECVRRLVAHAPRLCRVATTRPVAWDQHSVLVQAGTLPIEVARLLGHEAVVDVLAAQL